jgi:membrane associated rhomboid family serine protease
VISQHHHGHHTPLTWLGSVPIYATTVIVALNVLSMIGVAIALASGQEALLSGLTFHTAGVIENLEIWRCLTYAFVNAPDPWFIISLVMLYIFGRDVEQHLGRGGFVRLYGAFLLLGPSLLVLASLITGQNYGLTHSWANFAVFLSFAALYPNALLLLQIPAKVFAWVFLGISVLQLLAMRQWPEMLALLPTAALAWCAMRHGNLINLHFLSRLRPERRPHLKIVRPAPETPADPRAMIDVILDKISRQGLSSLSKAERARLERARAELMADESR